jgi:tetrahydromethanopterin S-methyltransferase subunit E
LKGVLVALLTGFFLSATSRWWSAIVTGTLYGLAFGLVIYLAKGGSKSGDAPYVIPSGIITGGLIGLFIIIWAVKTI